METYSDRTRSLRIFLANHSAKPLEKLERPDGEVQEKWLVKGSEVIIRILASGEWDAFIGVTASTDPAAQIMALDRAIQGKRPDLDILNDITRTARRFQDMIRDLPGCSDPACVQQACKDLRELRANIEDILKRVTPEGEVKNVHT